MDATLEDVTRKKKPEPSPEQQMAEDLVRRGREQGLSLTGPDGLLKRLTKQVLETALNQEMTEHLGHEKHGQPAAGNVCNGMRSKTVLTGASGQVQSGRKPEGFGLQGPALPGMDFRKGASSNFSSNIVSGTQSTGFVEGLVTATGRGRGR
jgi:hypothetical protein